MQWMIEPTGMLRIGRVLPALIGASGAGDDRRADLEAARGDDVAALAVGVDHQGDVGAAVRVVLDALDLRRNRVLVAHEIDDAIVVLVAATLVPRRDVAVVVAAGVLHLRLEQRRFGPALVQVRMRDLDDRTPPRRRRLDLDDGHYAPSPEKFSSWPGRERHIGLLDVIAPADRLAEALDLALVLHGLHRIDGDLEHQLDRGLDLRLGGVAQDLEQDLVVLLGGHRRLLADDRRDQDLRQATLGMGRALGRIGLLLDRLLLGGGRLRDLRRLGGFLVLRGGSLAFASSRPRLFQPSRPSRRRLSRPSPRRLLGLRVGLRSLGCLGGFGGRAHDSISFSCSIAPLVTSTFL